MNWPQSLMERDFKPSMAESISGYSQALQRKWAQRYFDFRGVHNVIGSHDGGRWYSWIGIQMLTIFGDVLGDLGQAQEARAALMVDPLEGHHRDVYGLLSMDIRTRQHDLFAVRNFEHPAAMFMTAGEDLIVHSGRYYAYNLSAMQRRLHETIKQIDGG